MPAAIRDVTLNYEHVPDANPTMPRDEPQRRGRFFYLGLIFPHHFGHFMAEGLSRLWAYPTGQDIAGIPYYSVHPDQPEAPFIASTLRAMGITAPLIRVDRPMGFEQLIVAQPHRLPNGFTASHPALHDRIQSVIQRHASTPLPRKLFVSRTGFSTDGPYGQVFLETTLADHLRAQGYHEFQPEAHSFEAQLAQYHAADHLIFIEGSALHAYALAARRGQQLYIVQRQVLRNTTILAQIKNFADVTLHSSPRPAHRVPAREAPMNGSCGLAIHAMQALLRDIQTKGMIGASDFTPPPADRVQAEIAQLQARFDVHDHIAALELSLRKDTS